MNKLTGKVAVVTGGSRGLGRADSLALARGAVRVSSEEARMENGTALATRPLVVVQANVAQSLLVSLSGTAQAQPNYWLNVKTGVNYAVVTQTPQARVVEFLEGRRLLLVLDNFEHLLPAATRIATLLATCPGYVISCLRVSTYSISISSYLARCQVTH